MKIKVLWRKVISYRPLQQLITVEYTVVVKHRHNVIYLGKCFSYCLLNTLERKHRVYRKVSNIRRTLVSNKIVYHSDVVGASPVGAAPTTSSFSTNTWLQLIGQWRRQDETRNVYVWGFGPSYIKELTVSPEHQLSGPFWNENMVYPLRSEPSFWKKDIFAGQQTMTVTNAEGDIWRHMASQGHTELLS